VIINLIVITLGNVYKVSMNFIIMIDLNEIGDTELRKFGFHDYMGRPINYWIGFEITKWLDNLRNDQERSLRVVNLGLRPFTHPQVPNERPDLGLELDWQKLGEVYVPSRWKEYMQDKTRDWNMGFIGILSWDEMGIIQDDDLLNGMNFDYNRDVLQLTPPEKIQRLVSDSEWRKQIELYSQAGLEQYRRSAERELSEADRGSVQQSYLLQIIPLINHYILKTKTK